MRPSHAALAARFLPWLSSTGQTRRRIGSVASANGARERPGPLGVIRTGPQRARGARSGCRTGPVPGSGFVSTASPRPTRWTTAAAAALTGLGSSLALYAAGQRSDSRHAAGCAQHASHGNTTPSPCGGSASGRLSTWQSSKHKGALAMCAGLCPEPCGSALTTTTQFLTVATRCGDSSAANATTTGCRGSPRIWPCSPGRSHTSQTRPPERSSPKVRGLLCGRCNRRAWYGTTDPVALAYIADPPAAGLNWLWDLPDWWEPSDSEACQAEGVTVTAYILARPGEAQRRAEAASADAGAVLAAIKLPVIPEPEPRKRARRKAA